MSKFESMISLYLKEKKKLIEKEKCRAKFPRLWDTVVNLIDGIYLYLFPCKGKYDTR